MEQPEGQAPDTKTQDTTAGEQTGNEATASLATAAAQGQEEAGSWDDLPDDIRPAIETKFKTKGDLAKSYLELQKKLGVWPGENASEEDKAQFFARIGRPETADAYEIDFSEVPDGFIDKDKAIADIKKSAYEAGLSAVQAKKLAASTAATLKQQVAALADARKTADTELRKEWGEHYDDNLALVGKVVNEYGGDGIVHFLDKTGAGNNPDFIQMMAKLGQALSEDTLVGGSQGGDESGNGRDEGLLDYPNTPELQGKGRYRQNYSS